MGEAAEHSATQTPVLQMSELSAKMRGHCGRKPHPPAEVTSRSQELETRTSNTIA